MLISQSEWARQQGFSRQYVSKLVKSGTIQLVDNKVETAQAEAALASIREPARDPQRKQISESVPKSPQALAVVVEPPVKPISPKPAPTLDLPAGGSGDLSTLLLKARIKSELKRGSLLEIREKVETGKLVDADEMHTAAFNRARAIRAAWEAWPNRVAGPMGAELGVEMRTLRSTLEKFVREHLLELSGTMEGTATDE